MKKHLNYLNHSKYWIYFFQLILFVSCKPEPASVEIGATPSEQSQDKKPFSNPALIYGSSFGHFWQSLLRNGQYETMIRFTSQKTVQKFGTDALKDFYQNRLKFDFILGNLSNAHSANGITTLIYANADIVATRRIIKINVVTEHDSCKIILNELKEIPF